MWIAPTAFTAFCNDIRFITRNIGKDSSAVLLFYNSSDRNTDNKVFGIFTTASSRFQLFGNGIHNKAAERVLNKNSDFSC